MGWTAEALSTAGGHTELTAWLVLSRAWTPLHHFEVVTAERARALLRADADLHARPAAGVPTPFERARDGPAQRGAAQALILRAAEPWSAANHDLFPAPARAHARLLALVGQRLAATRYLTEYAAFMDVWVGAPPGQHAGGEQPPSVMGHAVRRDLRRRAA